MDPQPGRKGETRNKLHGVGKLLQPFKQQVQLDIGRRSASEQDLIIDLVLEELEWKDEPVHQCPAQSGLEGQLLLVHPA